MKLISNSSLFVGSLLALLLLPAAPAKADDLPSIAVMDLKGGSVSKDLISVVSAAVARSAKDTEAFNVISGADIRALLTLETQKTMCGAESESCLAEIGGALGADYMVQGSLKKIGDKTILDLVLLEVAEAKALNRVNRTVSGEASSLIDEVPGATVQLLSKALEGRIGTLVVSVSEAGSSVKIDGRIVGVSPLAAQKIPAGVHLVEVEKTGFITAREQVTVKANDTVARNVSVIPSPDFLDTYQRGARRMRLGAWISGGLVAVSAGVGVYFQLNADGAASEFGQLKSKYNTGASVADYQAISGIVFDGIDPVAADETAFQRMQTLRNEGQSAQTASYIGYGVAGAALLSTVYFLIAGDDPGRYTSFQTATASTQPIFIPTPGGAFAGLIHRF